MDLDVKVSRFSKFLSWYRVSARLRPSQSSVLPYSPRRRARGVFLYKTGLASFMAVFVMVLFCINYSNNAGLVCACLLVLSWLVAVFANNWILARVSLVRVVSHPGDELIPGAVDLHWKLSTRAKPMCWVAIGGATAPLEFDDQGFAVIRWNPSPCEAGRHGMPDILVSTSWPLSIAYSWFAVRPAVEVVVSPSSIHNSVGVDGESGSSVSLPSSLGEPDGIKPRSPQETSSRWAWKATLRQSRPMTFEWSQAGAEVARIDWRTGCTTMESWRQLRADLDVVISSGKSFQVVHPWGATPVLRGSSAALSLLCSIGNQAFPVPTPPPVNWQPPSGISLPGWINYLLKKARSHG